MYILPWLTFFLLSAENPTEQNILSAIDQKCEDTWCEGDFDYKFDEIKIQNNMITLEYNMIVETDTKTFNYPSTCSVAGFSSFDSLYRNDDITTEFYNELNKCITANEVLLRKNLEG